MRSKRRCSCVLQFTRLHAVSCVLHRPTSRVIHHTRLIFYQQFLYFFVCFNFHQLFLQGLARPPEVTSLSTSSARNNIRATSMYGGKHHLKLTCGTRLKGTHISASLSRIPHIQLENFTCSHNNDDHMPQRPYNNLDSAVDVLPSAADYQTGRPKSSSM